MDFPISLFTEKSELPKQVTVYFVTIKGYNEDTESSFKQWENEFEEQSIKERLQGDEAESEETQPDPPITPDKQSIQQETKQKSEADASSIPTTNDPSLNNEQGDDENKNDHQQPNFDPDEESIGRRNKLKHRIRKPTPKYNQSPSPFPPRSKFPTDFV